MIEYQNINQNESGLPVRAKLNTMLRELISGKEGNIAIWKKIFEMITDSEDLATYVNAMHGGVSGFAPTTDYEPKVLEEKSATVIALGPGVYTHFLDASGNPITIEGAQSFTIFYKAEDETHWNHVTTHLDVVVDMNVDGGTAFTKYGGSKVVDGGNAEGR